ncbi:MAG: SDR family NAD(P)-dependent oxidoreductase, partial [Elusimicrobia bacterium]|nr:SDR family NAD(P)-dependent oxidoreductase [Elusimicrobiota bacterium]
MRIFDKDLLAGQRAVVTGAGTGIGRVIAIELARHGADVALAARNAERLEETAASVRTLGRKAVVLPTDVAEPDQVRAMVDGAAQALGGIDLLVNNAAANF